MSEGYYREAELRRRRAEERRPLGFLYGARVARAN